MKRALIVIVILFCIFTVTGSGLLLTANLPSMAYEGGSGSSASLKDEIEAHASGNWDSYRSSFSGSGTSSSPYIINTAGKLAQFSYMTRNNSSYRSKYYKITADINMSAHYFTPACGDGNPFTGRLDGGNYIISNLTISGGWLHTGLINMIEGTVQNVVLRNVSIDSDAVVGSIAGIVRDTGTISNCVVSSGNLYGAWVGGIVGTLAERGKVQGCLNKARINVDSGYSIPSQMGGGIVGKLQGEQEGSISVEAIKNCQNAGQVSSTSRAGGIVGHVTAGYNYAGSITNCFNRGSVNGTSYIGGIIGYSEGENKMSMFDCINVGTLSGTNYRGNIIGYCSSGFMLIWTCYYPSGGASAFGYKSSAVSTSSVSSITPGQYNLNTGAGVHTFMKNYSWSGDYKWNGWSSGVSYGNTVNNGYPLYSSSYTTVMIRNYNGPTNSTIVSKMIMYGELINIGTNSNSPTGYTLNGYYSGSNGAGTLYISRDGSSSYYGSASIPVYLYAYWNARVYTISLNPQNGSGGTGTIYLKYNTGWYSSSSATSSISSISRPSRTGYTFQGYYTATSGGTQIINSSGRILSGKLTYTTANDTLFAQWEANQYDVNVYVPDRTATPDITQPATIWNLTNGKQVQRTYGQSMTVSVALGAGYHFSHWEISGLSGTTTSTSQTFTFTMPANDVTLTAYAEKNDYTIDINVLSPGGVQDYNSGTFTAYFSENGQTYNNCTDQPYTEVRYNETIVISNIAPATGMSLASVTCGNGRITQSGGTYTYTATMTGTPSDSWDDTITIQMRWNYYTVDINIMSPAVVQDEASGSMDLRYADGTTAQDTTNEVVDSSTGTSKAIQYNTTITISDIRPFGVYHLKSVTCSNGRLVDNGDGSYTYTASMTFSPGSQGTWDDVIIIQMTYLQQDSDGNYYIEDGKYPQSYAEVEWDTYLGDGTYNGVSMTYDEKTKIITLNGTTSSGTTIFYVHGITFTSGQQYTTGYEYVSGGFSKTGNGTPVLYVDTVNSSNGTMNTRNYVDSVIGTSDRTATLTISNLSQSNADGFRIAMTTNGATATFNNYKIRFMVRYDSILNNVDHSVLHGFNGSGRHAGWQ